MTDFTRQREVMVERQLRRRGITGQAILDAFLDVPREQFVGANYVAQAYGDHPLPIAASQTISQPYIIALMIQAAEIRAGDTVLEVGGGSGYAAAVMSRIAARVIAIERQTELAEAARERLHRLGCDNVEIIAGDGTLGWPDEAPFDAILVAASGREVPGRPAAAGRPSGDAGRRSRLGSDAGFAQQRRRWNARLRGSVRSPLRPLDRGKLLNCVRTSAYAGLGRWGETSILEPMARTASGL